MTEFGGPRPLILASTSPYRRALLERLGLAFRAEAPRVDEDAWKSSGLGPRELAETLARAKAQSLADIEPRAVVVGSDQVVAFEGQVWGKPGTAERAVEQLLALRGRTHQLITAMAVAHDGEVVAHTDVTSLTLRPLQRVEIERYVAADRPIDCAGSYKLEQRGIALFESIVSADHTAITGLPLIALSGILHDLGFPLP